MNWDQIKDNWDSVCRAILLTWGKLTEDDLTAIGGRRDLLVITLQEKYAFTSVVAQSKVDQFARDL
ncbi:MAG: CsbD family protein [Planctomycetes bacterium]|nr:CsbD family protein [Planctomycetota bacterium]